MPSLPQRRSLRLSGYDYSQSGFTLIEMVVVIVIVGILAVLGGRFIARPVLGYVDLSRRAELVDRAEMALRRMQRDIRHALPNSIRIRTSGVDQYLEMINTVDGGRYRLYPDPVAGGNILDFSILDNGFDVLGNLSRVPNAGENVVIYNVTTTGPTANAYAAPPLNTAVVGAGSTVSNINLAPPFNFSTSSPLQRFFLVDGPVTYACEGGVLNRYSGYGLLPVQPTTLAGPALVTRGVNGCSFSYAPGTSQRAGLVTLQLSLTEEGEIITLLHQVHVVNVP